MKNTVSSPLAATTFVVPAVDLTPTGHVAYAADPASRADTDVPQDPGQAARVEAHVDRIIGALKACEWQEAARGASNCPVFRDCTETEPGHYDHHNHDLRVIDNADGNAILSAGMVALSGSDRAAIVYLRNAEFDDAASVHAKTAEIRRMLDEVDAMADRVFADHEARG
ncbi:hypothetical protein ACH47Z_18100 [Streptomyces sp. NPDC020192]|uniref:hypothetical protein n=1 Tax=Streptomyces sp. NPDC020192 TaxID=3365066 RepID=UPI0037A1127D